MSQQVATVIELEPITKGNVSIRVFQLSLHGITIEVSSVGASITKILLPNSNGSTDDIVLGYKSPLEMYESGNSPFLGAIVGRVANRIAIGRFRLDDREYTLDLNNGPNHLHGGFKGFNTCLWDLEIVELKDSSAQAVQCILTSPSGDQGYPGSVLVTATYSLQECDDAGVKLRLDMKAQLLDDIPSPINLAQHSYFNLAKHDHSGGILDHAVALTCTSYTPTDATSIPTRKVVSVKEDPAMDLTSGKLMSEVLKEYAVSKAGLSESEATKHIALKERCGPAVAKSGKNCPTPDQPYGIDHNYVIPPPRDGSDLSLVGVIEHAPTHRRMKIFTNAPGVQVYTGNYLDGINPPPSICKQGAAYGQWQGMCFETQAYPDSILTPEDEAHFPEFAIGKCTILKPGAPDYQHTVEYHFGKVEA